MQTQQVRKPCVTVFTRATDAFPSTALFSEPLDHPGLAAPLAAAANAIGYRLIV